MDESAPGFAEVSKSIVGTAYIFKGTLIKSPKPEQPFEL
jgi:hypothetical protein